MRALKTIISILHRGFDKIKQDGRVMVLDEKSAEKLYDRLYLVESEGTAFENDSKTSIAEKCFDIWGILKMASVKSVESGNNCFGVNHIIRCRSKFLPLGFSKFVLVLIL